MRQTGKPATRRAWLGGSVMLAAFLTVSIAFVDRPLATFIHGALRSRRAWFDALTHLTDLFPVFAGLTLFAVLLVVARGERIGPRLATALRVALCFCVAIVLKDQLKVVFGRTWPETWVANNPSYIRDGVFGFFPFHGGPGWASFPSGHMASAAVMAACAWRLWPRFRPAYTVFVALVAAGLIGADYHWLSDVAAGAALGVAVGAVGMNIGRPDAG